MTRLPMKYWYPLGQRKVILHDSIMTFLSVIPAMVHQNGGIWGAQFSKYLHYAHGMVLHDLPGGQYISLEISAMITNECIAVTNGPKLSVRHILNFVHILI